MLWFYRCRKRCVEKSVRIWKCLRFCGDQFLQRKFIMKAVLYEAFSIAPKIVKVPDPNPELHGVVIRVMATGVCRSDWHGWVGHDADIKLPHVPGHELAGIVEYV